MKKLVAMLSLFSLSSCIYAGDISVWDERRELVERVNSFPIDYFDSSEQLIKTEYISEKGLPTGEMLTAYKGYTVVDTKTYRKEIYADEFLRANSKGILNGASIPVIFKNNQTAKIIGFVTLETGRYAMIPVETSELGFVVLVKKDGTIGRRMGQIRHNRLVLLDADFIMLPATFRMEPVETTRSVQTQPVKGIDIKYEGIKLGRLNFAYMDYSNSNGDNGYFENLNFPYKEGKIINIKGVGIKVVNATDDKIDYIILKK